MDYFNLNQKTCLKFPLCSVINSAIISSGIDRLRGYVFDISKGLRYHEQISSRWARMNILRKPDFFSRLPKSLKDFCQVQSGDQHIAGWSLATTREILLLENYPLELIRILAHEIGHLDGPFLNWKVDEEAKAIAFEFFIGELIRKRNIFGLNGGVVNLSQRAPGLQYPYHLAAHRFVMDQYEEDGDFYRLHRGLSDGSLDVPPRYLDKVWDELKILKVHG